MDKNNRLILKRMSLSQARKKHPVARCLACKLILTREDAVTERVLKTDRGLYHTQHFKCSYCIRPLAGLVYTEQSKKIICVDCHQERNLPKCPECRLAIINEATEFDGRLYHYDCIKCYFCYNPLPNGEYFLLPNVEKKIPVDEDCYMIQKYGLQPDDRT